MGIFKRFLPVKRKRNKMTDETLIENIFSRLGGNFYEKEKPYYINGRLAAITDSEVAAESLNETLFNMGLDRMYDVVRKPNSDGLQEIIFISKHKTASTEEKKVVWSRVGFTYEVPLKEYDRLKKAIDNDDRDEARDILHSCYRYPDGEEYLPPDCMDNPIGEKEHEK